MKIVAIAPYPGLKYLIESVASERNDLQINVELGDLKEGVAIAQKAESDGADVIISRGGTAELIQQYIKIPVVEIEVSAYDLIRVLTLFQDNPQKKAILGFNNIIESAITLCNLLDIEIDAYTINNEEEVRTKLKMLQAENYQLIIGDVITTRYAEELGMNGVLLTSGQESVKKAIDEAVKVDSIFLPLMQEAIIPQTIIDYASTAYVVLDNRKSIIYTNPSGSKLINALDQKLIERYSEQILKGEEINTIIEVEQSNWHLKGYPLNYANRTVAVLTFNEEYYKEKIQGIRVTSSNHHETQKITNRFSTQSTIMNETIEKAKLVGYNNENVMIAGEYGTEKDEIAYLIHLESKNAVNPFVTVDCKQVNIDNLLDIFTRKQNESYDNNVGTFYLKNIEDLSADNQEKLYEYLVNQENDSRFIASSLGGISQEVNSGNFNGDLYYKLCQMNLTIPSLRERKEDIEGLIQFFINQLNFEYGRQVAGIRSEALQEMKEYDWPGNATELKQVVKEAVLLVEGPFIEKKDIGDSLKNKYMDHRSVRDYIQLNGTLKEMEQRIIHATFLNEGKNHSKTAARLGINRSTLWRKLKEIEK